MVWLAALASFLLLMAIGRWRGQPEGLALAFYIALGIGLHNFGEGLAIGWAFAAGSAGLGTFLVLGFALHNVTEGIGIAAPMLRVRPPLWTFAALTLLAGGPAVLGLWAGRRRSPPPSSAPPPPPSPLCGPAVWGRRPGCRGRGAGQPRLRPAMVSTGARRRGRGDPAGDCRSHRLPDAP